jgi:hypothetical protein
MMDLEGPDETESTVAVAPVTEAPVTESAPAKKVASKKAAPKKSTPKKGTTKPMSTAKTAKKSPAKKAAPKKESTGQRGRVCAHAGKKLFKVAKENPRRQGTLGYNSFKVIKDGMTYEQYIAKGGRLVDLNWDIEKGYVKVK